MTNGTVIEPEVKAVINGRAYRLALSLSAHYTESNLDGCIALGYDINTDSENNLNVLPRDAEIDSLVLKSNMNFKFEKLYWKALNYWKAPGKSWQDVPPTEIVDLSDLPN